MVLRGSLRPSIKASLGTLVRLLQTCFQADSQLQDSYSTAKTTTVPLMIGCTPTSLEPQATQPSLKTMMRCCSLVSTRAEFWTVRLISFSMAYRLTGLIYGHQTRRLPSQYGLTRL